MYDNLRDRIPSAALDAICNTAIRPTVLSIRMSLPYAGDDDCDPEEEDRIAERLHARLRQFTQALQGDRLRSFHFGHIGMDGLPALLDKAAATITELHIIDLNYEERPRLPNAFTLPKMPQLTSLTLGQSEKKYGDVHLNLEIILSTAITLRTLEVERYSLQDEQRVVAMFGHNLRHLKVDRWQQTMLRHLPHLETLRFGRVDTPVPRLPATVTTLQFDGLLRAATFRSIVINNRLQFAQRMDLSQRPAQAELLALVSYEKILKMRATCVAHGVTMLDQDGVHVEESALEQLLLAAHAKQIKDLA